MTYTQYQGAIESNKGLIATIAGVAFALAASLLLALSPLASAATEVTVSGDTASGENDKGGWLFNRDPNNATPIEFNTDAASNGAGSLYVEPLDSDPAKKFIGEYFLLEDVEDLDSFSYDFQIGSGGDPSDANEFYLNVYANFPTSNQLNYGDCVYNVVPDTGSSTEFTTVTFDPEQSYDVTTRSGAPEACPTTPADLGEDGFIRMLAINLGDTGAQDADLDGYFDNVVVNLTAETTVYDFEPAPADKDACKKGGYEDFGFNNQGQCIRFVNTGQDSR